MVLFELIYIRAIFYRWRVKNTQNETVYASKITTNNTFSFSFLLYSSLRIASDMTLRRGYERARRGPFSENIRCDSTAWHPVSLTELVPVEMMNSTPADMSADSLSKIRSMKTIYLVCQLLSISFLNLT